MLTKFNTWLASILADGLSTMACFYAVAFLVIAPLTVSYPDSLIGWTQYIVQAFFQGVSLPVISFVAKIEAAKTAKLLQENHDMAMQELVIMREEQAELRAIMERLHCEEPPK